MESVRLFLPGGEAKNFLEEGWTAGSKDCPSGKSVGLRQPRQTMTIVTFYLKTAVCDELSAFGLRTDTEAPDRRWHAHHLLEGATEGGFGFVTDLGGDGRHVGIPAGQHL